MPGILKLYKTGVHIHRTSSTLRTDVIPCYNKSSNYLLTDLGCVGESSLLWYGDWYLQTFRIILLPPSSGPLHWPHNPEDEGSKILRNVRIYQWTPCHVTKALNPYQHRRARSVEGRRNHLPSTLVLYLHCQFRQRVGRAPIKSWNLLWYWDKHGSKKGIIILWKPKYATPFVSKLSVFQ